MKHHGDTNLDAILQHQGPVQRWVMPLSRKEAHTIPSPWLPYHSQREPVAFQFIFILLITCFLMFNVLWRRRFFNCRIDRNLGGFG